MEGIQRIRDRLERTQHQVGRIHDRHVGGDNRDDRGVVVEDVGDVTAEDQRHHPHEETPTQREDDTGPRRLGDTRPEARPQVLADERDQRRTQCHDEHEHEHLQAAGDAEPGHRSHSVARDYRGDDTRRDRCDELRGRGRNADRKDALPGAEHLGHPLTLERKEPHPAEHEQRDHHRDRLGYDRRNGGSAQTVLRERSVSEHEERIQDGVDHEHGHHDHRRRLRVPRRPHPTVAHLRDDDQRQPQVPDHHVLSHVLEHLAVRSHGSKQRVDRGEADGDDAQRHGDPQRDCVDGEPAG